jgi:hypothetical protein
MIIYSKENRVFLRKFCASKKVNGETKCVFTMEDI